MSRNWLYALAAVAALAGASATPSRAAMLLDGLDPGAAAPSSVEETAYIAVAPGRVFANGRWYCWYDSGWRGPGYYWCGYAFRAGFGWGGGDGWLGHWRRGGGHWRGGHGGRAPMIGRPVHGGGRPHFGGGHHGGGRPHGGGGHHGGGRPHGGGGHHGGGRPHGGGGRHHR